MKIFWSWQLSAPMDFENFIEKELPVTSVSDFLLSKYILKG